MKSMREQGQLERRRLAQEIAMLLACGLVAVPAGAQTREQTLPAVQVTAKAQREEPTKAVVTAQELSDSQARDLREIFAGEPGVTVGGGGSGLNQKVYVRGMEENMLNVTVDGARQNGWVYHHQGRSIIDPQMLKAVEVSKGTPDAIAGPGALVGALRFTTKDAADLLRPGQALGATVGAGFSTNDARRASVATYGKLGESADFVAYGALQNADNYQDGNGNEVPQSASRQRNVLTKLGIDIAPGQRISLGYNGVSDEGDRYLRPNMVDFTGNNVALPTVFERDTMTLGWTLKGSGELPSIALNLYRDDNSNIRTQGARSYGESVKSSGVDLAFVSQFADNKLEYGLNYVGQNNAAINPVRAYNPAIINGADNTGRETSDIKGLYVQDTLALGRLWQFGVGARYDWYDYTDNHSQTFKADGLSPNASVTLHATDALSFRLGAARALRGAGPRETYLLDNGPGPRVYRNDADLKEEQARTIDLSMEYAGADWGVRAAVFDQKIDDYISYNFINNQARRYNAGTVKNKGYELSGEYRFATVWQVGASVAEAKPKLNGQPLSDADSGLGTTSGRTWRLGLQYAATGGKLRAGWDMRHVESVEAAAGDDANYRYTKDGYTVHDLQLTWLPLQRDTLSVRFAIRNLFDKYYYDQSTYGYNAANGKFLGMAEPGRDLRVDLSYKF